jgi:hypothetical protein
MGSQHTPGQVRDEFFWDVATAFYFVHSWASLLAASSFFIICVDYSTRHRTSAFSFISFWGGGSGG